MLCSCNCVSRFMVQFPFSICIMSFLTESRADTKLTGVTGVLLLVACTQEWKTNSFFPSLTAFDLSQDTSSLLTTKCYSKILFKTCCVCFFCTSSHSLILLELLVEKYLERLLVWEKTHKQTTQTLKLPSKQIF